MNYTYIGTLTLLFTLVSILTPFFNLPMNAKGQDASYIEPDIFFQFSVCLPENISGQITEQVRELFRNVRLDPNDPNSIQLYPNPYVSHTCINDKENLGIWVRDTDDPLVKQKREQVFRTRNVVQQGFNNFYMNIWGPFIDREGKWIWDLNKEKIIRENPGLSLNHFVVRSTSITSPEKVMETVVFGSYDTPGPFPWVDFQYLVSDTLSLADGKIKCKSDESLNADVFDLRAVLYAVVPKIFYPVFVPYFESYVNTMANQKFDIGGVGCKFASIAPNEIMIPGPLDIGPLHFNAPKIVFNHAGLDLETGITSRGTVIPKERDPKVSIVGPNEFRIKDMRNHATFKYSAITTDLRSDAAHPLSITWSSEGSQIDPHPGFTLITFPISNIGPGESVTKTINVNVVDADNLNAANSFNLFLFRDASCPFGTEWVPTIGECIPREPRCRPLTHWDDGLQECVPDRPELNFTGLLYR